MFTTRAVRYDQRVVREAEALQKAGHAVRLIEWARHSPDAPVEEVLSGIQVRRSHDEGLARFLPSDVLRNPIWWRRAYHAALAWHDERPVDVVHCHDLDTLPAGVRVKDELGCALVFDAHEVFYEMLEGNQPRPVVAAARRLEARLLPHADLVLTSHEGSTQHYLARTGAPVATIWNTFGERPDPYTPPPQGPFTMTYVGVLSRDRLFPDLVDAVGALDGVRLVIAGKHEGVHKEVAALAARASNVDFLGPVTFDQVPVITKGGHAVVCMLDPRNPQYRRTPATKLFDAMSAGRPIITTEGTLMGDFVTENDVGIACAYQIAAVQEATLRLRDDPEGQRRMGENGLRLARQRFHWEAQAQALTDAYRDLPPRVP